MMDRAKPVWLGVVGGGGGGGGAVSVARRCRKRSLESFSGSLISNCPFHFHFSSASSIVMGNGD